MLFLFHNPWPRMFPGTNSLRPLEGIQQQAKKMELLDNGILRGAPRTVRVYLFYLLTGRERPTWTRGIIEY
jgi:hypothetical protein